MLSLQKIVNVLLPLREIRYEALPDYDEDVYEPLRPPIVHPDYADRCLAEVKFNESFRMIKTGTKEWIKETEKKESEMNASKSREDYTKKDYEQDWFFAQKTINNAEPLLFIWSKEPSGGFMVIRNEKENVISYKLYFIDTRDRVKSRPIFAQVDEKTKQMSYAIWESKKFEKSITLLIKKLKKKKTLLDGTVLTVGIKRMEPVRRHEPQYFP
ncbi:hypothetical protein GCK72_024890 [Caenorhabditis remanei]|uniref:Uncharacterized protein n=1 Tax=Caenorhabditis remanei TaxID=31234 RepID=A0A6A5G0U6_CAERE|nr:hypothetical protein GCK72_024890 [Caenorhabditis remanei]KAF1748423.1 hypothetical protein GCK72_024890 [Caenorhabditis remanei]